MKTEIEAKRICDSVKGGKQRPPGLQLPAACGSNPSEEKPIQPDTRDDDFNVERHSIASSHTDHGIPMASQGPPVLHAVSFSFKLYRGEDVVAASTYRQAPQKEVS